MLDGRAGLDGHLDPALPLRYGHGDLGLDRRSGEQYQQEQPHYSTITRSLALLPKVSGWYISSALAGGTTKLPGVVARAT